MKNKAAFNYDRVKKLIDKNFPNVEFLPNIFDKVAFEIISSNKLYLVYGNVKRQVSYVPGLNIEWKGKNSVIEIGAKPVPNFSNCLISIGDNSRVFIDSSLNPIKRLSVCMQYENCELKIGKHLHCNGVQMLITCEPNKKIIIGDNCLFSYGICMRTSDGHSVLDDNTKLLLNNSSGIKIGNHVWIGQNVMLLKNTKIADNSIVGANSVLRKAYNEANVAICGNPAKITKTNINWSAAEPHRYNQNLI